jgi:response regulator NasT
MKALLLSDNVDTYIEYENNLKSHLSNAGYDQHFSAEGCYTLLYQLVQHKPDVIIIITESPTQELLDTLKHINNELPLPIIMMAKHSDKDTTLATTSCGVSVYIIDDWPLQRIGKVLDVAQARFHLQQQQESKLILYKNQLEGRKYLDKAKGILMEHRKISENDAHGLLRKMAMDQNLKIAEVAQNMIEAQSVLQGNAKSSEY